MLTACVERVPGFLGVATSYWAHVGKQRVLVVQGPSGAIINRCFTEDGGQAYGRKSTETWIWANRTPPSRLTRSVPFKDLVKRLLSACQGGGVAFDTFHARLVLSAGSD